MIKVKYFDTEIDYDNDDIPGRDEFDTLVENDINLENTIIIDTDAINNQISNGDENE